ncbi:MAG: hypothetical protein KDC87_14740 [Planctomycetes bacterium]|nr:hypothetical protein [Planctomycetota bacterium]
MRGPSTAQSAPWPGDGEVFVHVALLDGACLPVAQARMESISGADVPFNESVELCRTAPPLVALRMKADGKKPRRVLVTVYRSVHGRGLLVTFRLPAGQWLAIRPELIRVAQSVVVRCDPLPRAPGERPLLLKDRVGYSAGPSVTSVQLAAIQRLVQGIAGPLTRLHGAAWTSVSDPLAVYVNANPVQHVAFIGAVQELLDVQSLPNRATILTVPDRGLGSPMWRDLGEAIARVILHLDYECVADPWMAYGEQAVAGMAAQTGRPFPYAPRSVLAELPPIQWTLQELTKQQKLHDAVPNAHCLYYVLLFHHGPSEYRKAYAAFRAALRDAPGPGLTTAKHLFVLDQAKMRSAAAKLVKRLRPVPGVKW